MMLVRSEVQILTVAVCFVAVYNDPRVWWLCQLGGSARLSRAAAPVRKDESTGQSHRFLFQNKITAFVEIDSQKPQSNNHNILAYPNCSSFSRSLRVSTYLNPALVTIFKYPGTFVSTTERLARSFPTEKASHLFS